MISYISRQPLLPTNYDDLRIKISQSQRAFPYCRPGQALVNTFGMPVELEAEIYELEHMFEVYEAVIHYCLNNAVEMKGL